MSETPLRVLVVDDASSMRKIISRMVSGIGMEPVQAEGGQAALDCLRGGEHIDLILLDWNMPEMDGLEVLKAIRAEDSTKGIPVMMVTTESERASVVKAVQAGANDYLAKPFEEKDLVARVRKVLKLDV